MYRPVVSWESVHLLMEASGSGKLTLELIEYVLLFIVIYSDVIVAIYSNAVKVLSINSIIMMSLTLLIMIPYSWKFLCD